MSALIYLSVCSVGVDYHSNFEQVVKMTREQLHRMLDSIGSVDRGAIIGAGGEGMLLLEPERWIQASSQSEVTAALEEVDSYRRTSAVLAGWLSYDLGVHGLTRRPGKPTRDTSLFEFGVYSGEADCSRRPYQATPYRLDGFRFDWSRDDYLQRLERILEEIRAGNVYQVNFTLRLRFRLDGDPRALFLDLLRAQPATYASLLRNGGRWILSFSPELFLEWKDSRARMRPMKGTAPRGRFEGEDRAKARWLANDPKSRAENLMIVDLIRNDLGRVAEFGSVVVPSRYETELLPTLIQMTSTVEARLRSRTPLSDLLEAVFPCGSVTGAPKLAAMKLIEELESGPRGVYCGAIGTMGRDWGRMAVAIRTLSLEKVGPFPDEDPTGRPGHCQPAEPEGQYEAVLGIGSGIVADSVPAEEWEECCLKARFVTCPFPGFELIETLRCEGGRPVRLEAHLDRLKASAEYFGFCFDCEEVRRLLVSAAQLRSGLAKLRLLLNEDGTASAECLPLGQLAEPVVVGLAACEVDSGDRFLFHKTTHRSAYEQAQKEAGRLGLWDLLFRNERGEITEGSISNIFIRTGSRWWTPPLDCGLLPGVMRGVVRAELGAEERPFGEQELREAEEIVLTNSVRGRLRAALVE